MKVYSIGYAYGTGYGTVGVFKNLSGDFTNFWEGCRVDVAENDSLTTMVDAFNTLTGLSTSYAYWHHCGTLMSSSGADAPPDWIAFVYGYCIDDDSIDQTDFYNAIVALSSPIAGNVPDMNDVGGSNGDTYWGPQAPGMAVQVRQALLPGNFNAPFSISLGTTPS